ncbi:hypothetical protein RHS04_06009 [Rhizoctonia solani]|uniref:G-patch domain-containing protein n=2 Tax=Rhizoctonia solani TaxID=456999 RepID=A0A8H7H6M3_9AGAM|nr:hypothetical protein RHS04_06009 [Rhizoctonia solani]
MAQRLKRKLDNMGIDPASAKANENFCLIGTPLPSLASTKDANEFVPVWKQEVRDEKGRRRLHGAFTGGFSAGYFNTVGSKEGWAPSTFKSSRNARASHKGSRPEDFMDEEDLAEMRDSQQLVDTSESTELTPRIQSNDDHSLTSALQSLTLPSLDSPGAKLLRKMGWKPGQGVGPRVSYTRRRQQDIDAGVVPQGVPEDAEASKHLFAPRDTPVLLFRAKDNAHGLGHTGPVRLGGDIGAGSRPNEGPIISAGFGLGALNDADEDDIDVYDGSSVSRATRMAYDEIDDNEADGYSRRRPLTLSSQNVNRPSRNDTSGGGRSAGPVVKFNDGRVLLSGYTLSETSIGQDEWYPLPDVPQGWTADPRRVWTKFSGVDGGTNRGVEDVGTKTEAVHEGKSGWKNAPTAQERGAQLGEPVLPQAKKSVFEYLSQKDRDRLLNFRATATSDTPDGPQAVPPRPTVKPRIAPTTAPTAKAALLGFQPFTADPLRNARYTAYLQYYASAPTASDTPPASLGLLPDQNVEQFNKEMEDYAKAAAIFKPVTGAMAGRFVGGSSTIIGGAPIVEGGLYQPTYEKKDEGSTQGPTPIEDEDPKANAARLGMYGPLTHEVRPWYPHRLLCKRFGVHDPHPDGPPTAPTKTWEEEVGVAPTAPANVDLDNIEMKPLDTVEVHEGEGVAEQDLGPRDLANVGLGDDPHQGVDTLTYVRPTMDVFKAIFASDEEESDEEASDGNVATKPEAPISALDAALASVRRAAPPHISTKAEEGPEGPEPPVDLATFKPIFNLRTKTKDKEERKSKDKKSKKDKGKRAALSFDVDEDADTENASSSKGKRRERDGEAARKPKKPRTQDEDEDEWVEKQPPAATVSVGTGEKTCPDSSGAPSTLTEGAGPPRARKRAIDFM